ncbi:MAG: polysaccharide deacetylase family protein [Clostridia bacterium]|nr:polysaccharide deacetylase family protein [Clostridia bacterium]
MNKQSMFKLIVVILSVLFLATAVTSVVFAVKYANSNKELAELNSQLEDGESKLSDQISANESLKEENSSQAESFSQQYEKQSKENQSKVDELNKKIKDLNKQLAAKKNPTTTLPKPTPSTGKTVYLTFDDGPSSYTPQILDTLDKYGVKATFFVKNGGKYNYVMKDIVNRGHAIGLHTYTHDYKKIYSSDSAYFNDLNKISDLVYEQTGVRSKIIRFPGGTSNTVSKNYSKGIMTRLSKSVTEQGYVYFDWNCSNGDAGGANTVQKQLNECANYSKSASTVIVLMHDTKSTTRDALPKIIEYYKNCGFNFGVLTTSSPRIQHRANN